jgi:hypothetical protein
MQVAGTGREGGKTTARLFVAYERGCNGEVVSERALLACGLRSGRCLLEIQRFDVELGRLRRRKNVGVQTNGWSGGRIWDWRPSPSALACFVRGRPTPPVSHRWRSRETHGVNRGTAIIYAFLPWKRSTQWGLIESLYVGCKANRNR